MKEFTCIICPNGCEMEVEVDEKDNILNATGNLCKRGIDYVKQEMIDPRRNIATSVLVENGQFPVVSVRLTKEIPKKYIFDVLKLINNEKLVAPVSINQVVIKNVMGLESDVIVTKNVAEV